MDKALPVPMPLEDVWYLLYRYTLCLGKQEEDEERPSDTKQAKEKKYAPLHTTIVRFSTLQCAVMC